MPSFISDIQDRQLTAMWKKKYSEISSIYFQTREEIGGGNLCVDRKLGNFSKSEKCKKINQYVFPYTYTTLSPEFVNKFVSHLKVIDSCGSQQYGETKRCENYYVRWVGLCNSTVSYYGSLAVNHGSKRSNSPAVCSQSSFSGGDLASKAVLLADGTVIYFGGSMTGIISVDVNGFEKGPNVVGRDLFAVMVNEDWIKPIGAEGTFNTPDRFCKCSKDYGLVNAQSFLGNGNHLDGEVLSGACCSALKLN